MIFTYPQPLIQFNYLIILFRSWTFDCFCDRKFFFPYLQKYVAWSNNSVLSHVTSFRISESLRARVDGYVYFVAMVTFVVHFKTKRRCVFISIMRAFAHFFFLLLFNPSPHVIDAEFWIPMIKKDTPCR